MAGNLAVIFLIRLEKLEKLSNLLRRKMSKISVFMPESSVFLRWFAFKFPYSKNEGTPILARGEPLSKFALKSTYLMCGRGEV
ncbi:hypothetical protein MZB18_01570 [Haemophilus influenzae]